MDIKFHVSWPANLFHIVDNTSMWSPKHSRKDIRNLYEESFGISEKEDGLLSDYSRIRDKSGGHGLAWDFILAKDYEQAMASAKNRVTEQDFLILSDVFESFEENARILYKRIEPALKIRKQSLENELKNNDFDSMIGDVATFFEAEYIPSEVNAYLLINPSKYQRNGFNVGSKRGISHVTIEPVYLGKELREYICGDLDVILHEISHDILNNSNHEKSEYITDLVRQKVIDVEDVRILTEAVLNNLFPGGSLSVKYGLKDEEEVSGNMAAYRNIFIPKQDEDPSGYNYAFIHKLTAHLYPRTLDQLINSRSVFDGNYLEQAMDVLVSLKPRKVA